MQNRYTVFRRGAVFYCEDQTTGQQKSLQTRDEAEARRVVQAKNDAVKLPQMNLVMAKTYLSAQDPKMIVRTWADAGERFSEDTKSAAFINTALKSAIRCPVCQGYLDQGKSVSYDHKIEKAAGGVGSVENCQLTHPYCNQAVKNKVFQAASH
jgi:hypothetical protein